jgi:ABC-2 type transport system permease protein
MFSSLKFAGYCLRKNLQNSAELRTSFLLNVLGMVLNDVAVVIIWFLFAKAFGDINGWRAIDIIALHGFVAGSFGLVLGPLAGLSRMGDTISSGKFDQYLVSPKPLLLRVGLSQVSVSALGDIVFGGMALIFYAILAELSGGQVLLLLGGLVVSVTMFLAVLVSAKSASFFFSDGESIGNGLFEFFLTPSLFHSGAVQGQMRLFFTFVVPSLLVGGIPVEVIREGSVLKLIVIAMLAIFWLFLSLRIFAAGVRRYESSNFMTFGQ